MKSLLVKIRSVLLLFILLLSVFFCFSMPTEIQKAIASQSWEPRELLIRSSEVVSSRSSSGKKSQIYHSVRIIAEDLSSAESITISDVKYGDLPFTFSVFSKIKSSGLERYVQEYSAGKKVIGYKDPSSTKYVLEKGDVIKPVALLAFAVLWILGNVFIMIRYPKPKKIQNELSNI